MGAFCARGRAGLFFLDLVVCLAGEDCFAGGGVFVCGCTAEREKGAAPARSAAPKITATLGQAIFIRTVYCGVLGTTPERNIVRKRSFPAPRMTLNMTL